MTTTVSSSNSGDSVVGSSRTRRARRRRSAPRAPPRRARPRRRCRRARCSRCAASASPWRAASRPMRPIVSGVFGRCTVRKSAMATSSSSVGTSCDAELAGALVAHVRVVGDEPHAERVRPLRDEDTDAAEADDAERLAVELDALPPGPVPRAGLRRSRSACGTLRACASSSAIVCSAADSTFDCGAFTTITPRRGGRGDVDVVERRCRPARRRRGPSRRREHLGGDLRRAADRRARPRPARPRAARSGDEVEPLVDVEAGVAHARRSRCSAHAARRRGRGRSPGACSGQARSLAMRCTPSTRSSSPSANENRA